MSEPTSFPDHHSFHHEAMMTTFHLRICGEDDKQIRGLACECFYRIDELEQKLSRYFVGGDVSRINSMVAGETLHLSEECYDCLLVSMEACMHTGGLFDPTLGAKIEHQKSGSDGDAPRAVGQLVVHPDTAAITCEIPGKVIDLGGVGKGFALDQLALFLNDWNVEGALLSAGASTHLAMGKHPWPIDLAGDHDTKRLLLKDEALSASGTTIQGCHIVHPDESLGKLSALPTRIWSRSKSAAHADAWSTALMLMSSDEIGEAPSEEAMLSAVYVEGPGGFRSIEAT